MSPSNRPCLAPQRSLFPLCSFSAALLASVCLAAGPPPVDLLAGWSADEGAFSIAVALADLDMDGDLDAFVGDQDTPSTVWFNDGNAQFTRGTTTYDLGLPNGLHFGLFNNDAHPDLFIARAFSSNLLYFGDGAGGLTDSGQSIGTSQVWGHPAVGDLNGDGHLDVVTPTDDSSQPNEFFLGSSSGTLTAGAQTLGSQWSRITELADVDGDNDLDIFFGNNGSNALWLNDGNANFTDTGQTFGGSGTFGAAFGDLDGDNDLDAFIANGSNSGSPNKVFFNDGNGSFTDSGQSLGNTYSVSVQLLDIDFDGDLDAFVGNNRGYRDVLWLNDGNGAFTASAQQLGWGGAWGSAVGNLDTDVHPDLFLANNAAPDRAWLNNGSGALSWAGQSLGSSSAIGADLGDLDGDGDLDAFLTIVAGPARVLWNDGTGEFTESGQAILNGEGNNATGVALADLDGDNDLDAFVVTSQYSGAADKGERVWFNDGSGQFNDSNQVLGGESSQGVVLGDVDADGDIDALTATFGGNQLWLNDGTGAFSLSTEDLGINGVKAELGDVDGDGDLDAVFLRVGENQVYLNNGLGIFTDSGQLVGPDESSVTGRLADLDGDGDLDLLEGKSGANRTYTNDGNGIFTDSGQSIGFSTRTRHLDLLDIDQDGDLDIFESNSSFAAGSPDKVYLNDGSGLFTDSGLDLANATSRIAIAGNLDGLLGPDVFVACSHGDHHVWLNQATSEPIFTSGFESGDAADWQ